MTIAVIAVVCAGSAWLVGYGASDTPVSALCGLATVAAGTAVVGAALLRTWDREAGRRVCELRAARARDEWKAEDRAAELETELEEAHELCAALQIRLREKHNNLARLRTEHAALLRRYATAETERASALEGRRLLAIETDGPPRALSATVTDHRSPAGAPTSLSYLQADEAVERLARNAARQRAVEDDTAPRRSPNASTPMSHAPARDTARRDQGDFDFFGAHATPPESQPSRSRSRSAASEGRADDQTSSAPAAEDDEHEESERRAAGKVIDLGAHSVAEDAEDDAERSENNRLDIAELRSAIS